MKKYVSLLLISLVSLSLFAQIKVDAKKLGKTLESNTDATAVYTCDMRLKGMKISDDGTVTLLVLAKNKVKIVSDMDMTNIAERLNYANKKTYLVTFETTDLVSKTYNLSKIDGIETVVQYKERWLEEQKAETRKNITKFPVQVVNQEVVNISGAESAWLPGQVQDKLKSNLQEYLGMKTVVDSKSEEALKKLQAESEDGGRDESTAIELGKITTAKFAVFTKLRKTGSGYTLSLDFTDLNTGEQVASCTSKEYSKAEYLYGSTGAVDELTLVLANKLNIKISDLNRNLLASGSANFSVDAQFALAKQNEEQYQKMMKDYDAELSKLMTSNDINAIQNKNRIEAEKALLLEKQNSEKKRQEELKAQMVRAAEDEKLEAERSIALKTQRDQMAKDAAAKAAEVRKLKMEKQGVLGQINVIENKKKALVEIRQGVENRSVELYDQMLKDKASEESRIRNKSYSTVELGSDGQPTEQAKQRRENQVIKNNDDLTNKFFADCDAVKKATATQDAALLAEIRGDQKTLATTRTVSSMGDELKVSYGKYEGSKNGWNAYLSLYSDGILLYTDNFIVNYEALSGKKAPNMETELDDAVIEEYTNNVDMYNSLLTRGDPIIYFEIDYNVTAEGDEKPSLYKFNFSKLRVINTVSGKVTQTSSLNKVQPRTMKPEWDLRESVGIVDTARRIQKQKNTILRIIKALSNNGASEEIIAIFKDETKLRFIKNEELDIYILNNEIPNFLYDYVMKENPSTHKNKNLSVNNVTWYDAIVFCNKLSQLCGLQQVYSFDNTTNFSQFDLEEGENSYYRKTYVRINDNANGFRLPYDKELYLYSNKKSDYLRLNESDALPFVRIFNTNGYPYSNYKDITPNVIENIKCDVNGFYNLSRNHLEWSWESKFVNNGCNGHDRGFFYPEYPRAAYYYPLSFRILRKAD